MTGFGKAAENSPYGRVTVEIKTLNHKSLSINCTPFDGFFLLEEKLKKILQEKLFRGKTFVKIAVENTGKNKVLQKIGINENVAKEYLKKIKKAKKELAISGDIEIKELIGLPGVIEYGSDKKVEKLWPYIKKATEKALTSLITFRKNEGRRLSRDFKERLRIIQKAIKEIKKYEKQSVADYRKKLSKTIDELVGKGEVDKSRIEQEVAIFAKNCDIAEEVVRLEHHCQSYKKTIEKAKQDVGKKLDFIAQEMHRETNTIGAKASDFRISRAVIDIKSEIEKTREQLKNIE